MLARHYDKKIEICHYPLIDDGFGGLVPSETPEIVGKPWAKITTNAGQKFTAFGITDFKTPTLFQVRGRKNGITYTENHFVMYKGKRFAIKGVENRNLEDMEINLYCDES